MGITAVELVRAKVREVEALDEQIAHLTRRREGLVEDIASIRDALNSVTAAAPVVTSRAVRVMHEAGARAQAPRSRRSSVRPDYAHHVEIVRCAVEAEAGLGLGEIAARTGLAVERAKYILHDMRAKGLVVATGVKAGTRYAAPAVTVATSTAAPVAPALDRTLEVTWRGGMQTSTLTGQPLTDGAPVEAYRQRSGGTIA